MTIPESSSGSSQEDERNEKKTPRKIKIALKYTVRTENHGHKKVDLIPG